MTKFEALLKLLRIQPEPEPILAQETGWGAEETAKILRELYEKGLVAYRIKTNQFCRVWYAKEGV